MNGTPSVPPTSRHALEQALAHHRIDLTGYCYRMLGSAFDADDAVQETLVRAWQAVDRFEGRAAMRTWLHRIATNVCLDMLERRKRRARPMELGPAGSAEAPDLAQLPQETWIYPIPDDRALPPASPADQLLQRETLRLAFVAALQRLPPRQRAVLLLRDVLGWSAADVAELLGVTVATVTSLLQRARATLAEADARPTDPWQPLDEPQRGLLDRFLHLFERYDVDGLATLLREDAILSMPPYRLWLRGPREIGTWLRGPGAPCRGSRLLPVVANGTPAFGQYRPSGPGGRHEPWALLVLELQEGRIVGLNSFLDTERLFPLFGLPPHP